ncbi:MAG TPA: hypothetical protein VIE64_07810 [Solirubrobacterales bacterium]|jgi:hypothetical protein
MSAEAARREVPEPGELVYVAKPSWVPAFFGFAAALAVCGSFATFMVPNWVYAIIGTVVVLALLRTMIRSAVRSYFGLPRKQRARGAVLPIETIGSPRGE